MTKLIVTQLKEQVNKKGELLYGDGPGCWALDGKKGCSGAIRWTAVVQGLGTMNWCNDCKRAALEEAPEEPDKVVADL